MLADRDLVRMLPQIISFTVSLFILVCAVCLLVCDRRKGNNFEIFVYGLVGAIFYFLVLFFPSFDGNHWSPIRSTVQYTQIGILIYKQFYLLRKTIRQRLKTLWNSILQRPPF